MVDPAVLFHKLAKCKAQQARVWPRVLSLHTALSISRGPALLSRPLRPENSPFLAPTRNACTCTNRHLYSFDIQSFQMTEYFNLKPVLSVRLCVCLFGWGCVCHSLFFEHFLVDFDETWNTWSYQKCETTILKMLFSNAALSRSQFCFDFLQNNRQESLVSSHVCYLKISKIGW